MLLDITRLLDRALHGLRPTGVDRVGLAYVRHFGPRAAALVRFGGRWLVIGDRDSDRLYAGLLSPSEHFSSLVRWLVGRAYCLSWQSPTNGAVLLNVTHSGLDDGDYAARVRRYGLRPVYFLHDLIPIEFPEYARPGEPERHRRRVDTMANTGAGLIVNSACTRQAFDVYAGSLGMKVPPRVVAHLGTPEFSARQHKLPLDAPYFVALGTIEPRKNHLLLLHVWRDLVHRLGAQVPRLVIIGRRGWECEQVVDLLERCEALRGVVIEIPDCDDQMLAAWLSHARALLFPSFAEGYGIPLVEALSLGTPVIASDLPVFRELAGDIPEYLDPLDGPGWREAIVDFASPSNERRAAQLARLTGWRSPTWEAHFEKVEAFLKELGV